MGLREREGLGDLLDPTGVNTLSADANPPHLAAHASPHRLQIGLPDSLALVVSVANVVSDGPSLATDCADSCHDYFLDILSIISVVE